MLLESPPMTRDDYRWETWCAWLKEIRGFRPRTNGPGYTNDEAIIIATVLGERIIVPPGAAFSLSNPEHLWISVVKKTIPISFDVREIPWTRISDIA